MSFNGWKSERVNVELTPRFTANGRCRHQARGHAAYVAKLEDAVVDAGSARQATADMTVLVKEATCPAQHELSLMLTILSSCAAIDWLDCRPLVPLY